MNLSHSYSYHKHLHSTLIKYKAYIYVLVNPNIFSNLHSTLIKYKEVSSDIFSILFKSFTFHSD